MYNIQKINQAPIQKNLNTTRLSYKDLHTAHYTPIQRKIDQYLWRYQKYPWIKLSNATIAKAIGCSIITVIRATNKFHRDGYITKHQEHQYSSNTFTFSIKPVNSNNNIVTHRNDIPNKSLILDSLLLSKYLCRRVYVGSYAGARGDTHTNKTHVFKKGTEVNATQKQMILAQRHDPKIKDVLNTPSVRAQIITPTIDRITQLLHLDEKEQLKLVAFSEDAIEHTFSEVASSIHSGKLPRVSNRMEWVLRFARDYCTQNNIKPDWSWYYTLCDIWGISSKTVGKPLVISPKSTKSQHTTHNASHLSVEEQVARLMKELKVREERLDTYGGSVYDKKTITSLKQQIEDKEPKKGKLSGYEAIMNLPLDERILKLRSELAIHQERFACYTGPEYMRGLLGRMIERVKIDLNDAEVRSNSEKQVVQHTNNTDTLAEDGEECESFLRPNNQGQGFLWPVFKSTARG